MDSVVVALAIRSIRSSSSLKEKNIIKSRRVGDEHEKIENQTCAHAAAPFGSNCDTEELAKGLWMRVERACGGRQRGGGGSESRNLPFRNVLLTALRDAAFESRQQEKSESAAKRTCWRFVHSITFCYSWAQGKNGPIHY